MKDTYDDEVLTKLDVPGETTPNPVEKDRRKQAQQGHGALTIAAAMAGGYRDGGQEPRIVYFARLFIILFAMLLPSLLLIHVVL